MVLTWLLDGGHYLLLSPNPIVIRFGTVLFSFVGPLILWRLYAFTIKPWFRPNEPKELPYWIPCEYASAR